MDVVEVEIPFFQHCSFYYQGIIKTLNKMTDKFPELDIETSNDVGVDMVSTGDFLQREKDVLGDNFESDFPAVEVATEVDEDDFDDFSEPNTATEAISNVSIETPKPDFNIVNHFENLNLDESEHIKSWKAKRAAEIEKKEESFERKKKDTLAEAEKSLDAFYETYNSKKEDALKEAKEAQEKFIADRDIDRTNTSVWDSAIEILALDKNASSVDDDLYRDKTRFKDILLALKGKTSVPGSA